MKGKSSSCKGENCLYLNCYNKRYKMNRIEATKSIVLKEITGKINDSEILHILYSQDITWKHVQAIKHLTDFKDEILSSWLNVSVKTFREYKKPRSTFKGNFKEQVLHLLSLFKHGVEVFGSITAFDKWLHDKNFYFDSKTPASFINTITGIKFVDERLTAMEYGDNV